MRGLRPPGAGSIVLSSVVVCLLLCACGPARAPQRGSPPATPPSHAETEPHEPTTPATPGLQAETLGPPFGTWYEVRFASTGHEAEVGASLHFDVGGYDVVTRDGRVDRRVARDYQTREGAWHIVLADRTVRLEESDGGYSMTDGEVELSLVPSARGAELDAAIAAAPSRAGMCVQAARCCEEASALLAIPSDLELQLGDRSAQTCANTIAGFRMVLAAREHPVPPSCAAP